MHEVPQPVLRVMQFGAVPEPLPVQIGIPAQDPGQSFNQARVQVPLHDCAENDFGGIAHCIGTNMLEAGVVERGKLSLKFIGWNLPNVERLWQGKSSGRESIKLRGLASEFSTGHPQSRFKLRQIRL
jgi:hypothetical protein